MRIKIKIKNRSRRNIIRIVLVSLVVMCCHGVTCCHVVLVSRVVMVSRVVSRVVLVSRVVSRIERTYMLQTSTDGPYGFLLNTSGAA